MLVHFYWDDCFKNKMSICTKSQFENIFGNLVWKRKIFLPFSPFSFRPAGPKPCAPFFSSWAEAQLANSPTLSLSLSRRQMGPICQLLPLQPPPPSPLSLGSEPQAPAPHDPSPSPAPCSFGRARARAAPAAPILLSPLPLFSLKRTENTTEAAEIHRAPHRRFEPPSPTFFAAVSLPSSSLSPRPLPEPYGAS